MFIPVLQWLFMISEEACLWQVHFDPPLHRLYKLIPVSKLYKRVFGKLDSVFTACVFKNKICMCWNVCDFINMCLLCYYQRGLPAKTYLYSERFLNSLRSLSL